MMILCVRTDKPEAELYLHDGSQVVAQRAWQAHRQLAETIHIQIRELLADASCGLSDLGGIVTYTGPGSFTGLRIGLSVTNALAYALAIDAAGATGSEWLKDGINKIAEKPGSVVVMPDYGAPVHITQPKK